MKLILLLTFTLLSSCLSEQRAVREITTGSDSTSTTSEDNYPDLSSTINGTDSGWFENGNITTTVTLDIDNKKNLIIAGDAIQTLVKGEVSNEVGGSNTYCLEASFVQSASHKPKRVRFKVTPYFSTQLSQGYKAYVFLVNSGTEIGNSTACNYNSIQVVNEELTEVSLNDSDLNGVINSSDISIAYKIEDICPTCQGIISSTNVKLFKVINNGILKGYSSNTLLELLSENLYDSLTLRVDPNNNSDSSSASCSNSECVAQGFDCCLDGQCIKEKNVKIAGVTADPAGFNAAEAEKLNNEYWYKDYPQFYYACLEDPDQDELPPSDPADPEDPIGDSDTRLEESIKDFNCVEELIANSISDPFHKNPYNTDKSYTACNMTNSADDYYYQTVMKRLYTNCGCTEKNDLNQMISICPAYTYKANYETDAFGNETTTISSISCITPPVDQTPLPFQDLDVLVNTKSAPHRFFDTNNVEIYTNETVPANASGIQEGDEFSYLDDGYIFPNNGKFNMNSIIGQMTVQLDKAIPAYKINVDFDKQYLIATKSGFFQTCPGCAKDSWFDNFSANPFANYGVGVQAVGWTTERDTYGSNTTLGNYEDTIFGRACFVPPTMLPYSHVTNGDPQQQRLNRLKTQAALFINGYQRDWYGFNKGALIGSFDGVTWFAIGKGRIVQSTTNTLYLAINSPFSDLTTPTNHIVSIQEYQNQSSAARYDFDPSLEINDSSQNEAASCQEWHSCETDSHCITKLGWEYTCADVTYSKTNWPTFEVDKATEIANAKKTDNIAGLLQQGQLPPGSSTKRCVYRGAGSPCRLDYANISDETLRKNLTCAPNFYCAPLSSSKAFNSEVARYARPLDELINAKNHLYGQDSDILGRPRHYLNTGNLGPLPSEAITALSENLSLMDPSGAGNFGICRPGKKLPAYNSIVDTKDWNPAEQHKSADPGFRTDYISQIGGCNSTLYTSLRYASCPFLDEDGNYIYTQDSFLNDNFMIPGIGTPQSRKSVTGYYSMAQNSCGLESLSADAVITQTTSGSDLKPYSAFKTIEGEPLGSSSTIIEQTFARDACMRKAGAVCHTDLDCSPNKLQASVIDLVPESFFGNLAEKSYFEEYLVCGQKMAEPTGTDDPNFNTYSMHNNKCCRPTGQDLTMYTEDSPNAEESIDLNTSAYGALNPIDSNRYSRYSVVDSTIDSFTKKSNIIRPSANTRDSDGNKVIDNSINITNANQWKTIHSAASRTCCGGTWVRKFEDGTNNWSINRLNFNPANFSCLNYRSALALTDNPEAYDPDPTNPLSTFNSQLDKDKIDFCFDPSQTASGCAQHDIDGISSFTVITKPTLNTQVGNDAIQFLSSSLLTMDGEWINNPFTFGFFVPYSGFNISDNDFKSRGYVLPWSDDDDPSNITRKNLITRIPTFVSFDNISDLKIRLTDPNPTANPFPDPGPLGLEEDEILCSPANISYAGAPFNAGIDDEDADWHDDGVNYACPDAGVGTRNCCYLYDPLTRVLRVGLSNADKQDAANYDNKDSELRINFVPVGTLEYEGSKAAATTVADPAMLDYRRSSDPGNALYYLKKLGKLEYVGIPQMVYEPIYCNDVYQNLVPGIFKEEAFGQALKTVMDFLNHDRTFYDSSLDSPWNNDSAPAPLNANSLNQNLGATQELLEVDQIFSDNQFKCCLELGTEISATDDSSLCCSGTAVVNENNESLKTCKLPVGTDLTVYFNKFVSGEGVSSELETPLDETDFDEKTGEPKLNSTVLTKLQALGEKYCATGSTRRGSAFGEYRGQPVGTQGSIEAALYSIVDDPADNEADAIPERNYNTFVNGFRWNHHIYCGYEE